MVNGKTGRLMVGQCEGKAQNAKVKKQSQLLLPFAFYLLTFALYFGPSASLSQGPPSTPVSRSPQQAFVLHAQTNEVLVDVRVHDKSGNPVAELRQAVSGLTEEGVQKPFSDSSLEEGEKLGQATGGN